MGLCQIALLVKKRGAMGLLKPETVLTLLALILLI